MTKYAFRVSPPNVDVIQVSSLDQLLGELDPPDGVAQRVEGGRPHPDAHHVGDDEDEGARHARLGREADVEGELPRVVVHAAAVHQGEHIPVREQNMDT